MDRFSVLTRFEASCNSASLIVPFNPAYGDAFLDALARRGDVIGKSLGFSVAKRPGEDTVCGSDVAGRRLN